MRYGKQIRQKVVNFLNEGITVSLIASNLKIHPATVRKYKQELKNGTIFKDYKQCGGFESRYNKQAIKEYVEANPDKYLREIQEVFTISETHLIRVLKELDLTLKKRKYSTKKEMK